MKKILHIISSPRGAESNSTQLGNTIIEKIKKEDPQSKVTVNNVLEKDYEPLQAIHVTAYRLPEDHHSLEHKQALRDSDTAVSELFDADVLVVSVPLYNFAIPAALKGWIDHIVRPGKTFSYQTGKPEGLLKGKKVYLAIASNGVYTDGPMKSMDYAEPYLRFILGFIGLTDITTYRIEGAGIPGVMETAVQKGLESVLA
ncbi:FMN-dependent NADH-azoreductase [Chryseolinea soli]|uniref:FMN dependent NADH:quinone oxidoreductase n=1 Tax=Chryseolinea soli TaxID=2321403 RepID=A0A385SX70_9BACT|nr:NAD(P)H-dependent oxidoreductase [Chryseolinea soli]AYB35544.1 FMN-dependent NADH-azoreductase [Chryseolinea soli]